VLRGHERDRRGARVGTVGGILVADGRNGDPMLSSVTDGIGLHPPGTEELVLCLEGELVVGPEGSRKSFWPATPSGSLEI
jgi:hypothetical protein